MPADPAIYSTMCCSGGAAASGAPRRTFRPRRCSRSRISRCRTWVSIRFASCTRWLSHPNPGVVVIEYRGGALYLERSEDVTVHAHVFDRIRATVKGPVESIAHISHLANDLDVE
jgi:hypothetical protein